jgi:biotin carboxylase
MTMPVAAHARMRPAAAGEMMSRDVDGKMKCILVLFPKDWDRDELAHPRYRTRYTFIYEGFDLFRFPENARLIAFDVRRYIEKLVRKYRGHIDGVISNNEQFGALIAAVVAQRLGLPGTDPAAIIAAQHKYYARCLQQKIVPDATPRFSVFPYQLASAAGAGLAFPFYVKPVKATYSVLARRVDNFAQLQAHLRFNALEKLILHKLINPFNDLMACYTPFAIDALHLIGEELMTGVQVSLDGFLHNGNMTLLGIVDEVMYPGTQAFMRFEYPSRLPAAVQARMKALAGRLFSGIDYGYGFFNVELMYQPATGAIQIIEINPHMASQLVNLYRRVDGYDPYQVLMDLALGVAPRVSTGAGAFGAAASFVFRRFDGREVARAPQPAQIESVHRRYPDARLMLYLKRGASLAREMKWLGSYRYAVLNLGGASAEDLHRRYDDIRRELSFD